MAEVLAPIQVQQSASITMLHPSPDHFQSASSGQSHSQPARLSQMPRAHSYTAQNGSLGYRASSAAPVSPYAFQSTPQLRLDNRLSTGAGAPMNRASYNGSHSGQSHASSISTNASTASSSSARSFIAGQASSKDDMALPVVGLNRAQREAQRLSLISLTSSVPDLSLTNFAQGYDSASKPSPNRYRRSQQRQDSNTASQSIAPGESAATASMRAVQKEVFAGTRSGAAPPDQGSRSGHVRTASDETTGARQAAIDAAKRYRRRSLGSFETGVGASAFTSPVLATAPTLSQPQPAVSSEALLQPVFASSARPISAGGRPRDASNFGSASARPNANRRESHGPSASVAGSRLSPRPSSPLVRAGDRSRSPLGATESAKRPAIPSPLSRPVGPDGEMPKDYLSARPSGSHEASTDGPAPPSAAVQHLAALSEQDSKGKKSRLRRAFSFGSAAELRRASAQNAHVERERAKLTKERPEADLREAQDAAIAAKQEAAGIGNSIYSGQGGVFASSTDNLSISSTASSASLMLRKMGKGVKKGAKSVKGLFRPKSVIGVPAADGPVHHDLSTTEVSMVTVEAERERVNVGEPRHADGGTGFPHLERNSLDVDNAADAAQASSFAPRKSIVGGDVERDEVLKAVRKGILKRTGTATSSGTASPAADTGRYDLAGVPMSAAGDSPASSTPGSPMVEVVGLAKAQTFSNSGYDYFGTPSPRPFASQSTRSLPNSPSGPRNIAFNPRLQFHDVWSPTEYDRRGDIATCNRLTPMLAQQIKEELNSFKMEMEVHELSKPHTHFF